MSQTKEPEAVETEEKASNYSGRRTTHTEASVIFLDLLQLYESDYSSGDHKMVETTQNDLVKIEPLNMQLKIGNIATTLPVDSGSTCSFLNHSFPTLVVNSSSHAFWVPEIAKQQLQTFSNEPIQIEGKVQTSVSSKGWYTRSATFTVVADGLKTLIGPYLYDQLGLAVTQSSSQKSYLR